ncbi:SDR family oxidoreductase [Flavobacterium sp.]|uniref:SDR family oxidoreductase n=1 Tax=Flavobacterium sp. TaxID=239 RepID=UPI0031D6B695
MKKTVLITGTSSGFGLAAAQFFAENNWNVIATMRDVSKAGKLLNMKNVWVGKLNVEDITTIHSAIESGIQHFGRIDVIVNNAGYGLFGIFEGASREAIQAQFNVNVFGAMDVSRAILPHFRTNKSGTIINVSSGAGAIGFPMASLYSASKFALEGFSESLRYELGSLGIKVKVIEPGGALETNFQARVGGESGNVQFIEDYVPFLEHIGKLYGGLENNVDHDALEKVVASIFEAANDNSDQFRYTPTNDIKLFLDARRSSSEEEYNALTNSIFSGKS